MVGRPLASLLFLALLSACNSASELQGARDQGIQRAVNASIESLRQSNPEIAVSEPSNGWLAAVRSASGANIDWHHCRERLKWLAQRQQNWGRPTAEGYSTVGPGGETVGPTFEGLSANEIAAASVIWAGAELDHRIGILETKDAIAQATQSTIRSWTAGGEPSLAAELGSDPAMIEASPGAGPSIEESSQTISQTWIARQIAEELGIFRVTPNDLECMRAAGLTISEVRDASVTDASGG